MNKVDLNPLDDDDPYDRVVLAVAAYVLVLVLGTVAYRILGLGWLDAFYQTLITVSTVGYGEVGTDITPAYRLVTSVLILFGVGIGLYAVGQLFGALMEGRVSDRVGRRRMHNLIERASGHVVICGWGQVGRSIAETLSAAGETVVVIDRNPDVLDGHHHLLVVVGEATDDDVLLEAGIERARSLVVALDGESDNLFVTLSGRALNPDLFIVTRAVGPTSGPKLMHAGANRVVNPHEIGAGRMSSFVLQPNVADFLGETMTDDNFSVRLGEIELAPGVAQLPDGLELTPSGQLGDTGLILLAIRRADGSFVARESPWSPTDGDVLIVLGTAEQHLAGREHTEI